MREPQRHPVEDWMRALPEEQPSLAWRAALNERLAREARRRPFRRAFAASGLAAAALAACAVWMAVVHRREGAEALQEELVAMHRTFELGLDVVGPGLLPEESAIGGSAEPPWVWSESDLEAL
ncbi:MAG: hypothetical protein N2109_03210 [Fimbriimonadales bacterium]|nr:hypothetical protein [Fimbriimonadales bacterium]